MDPYPNCQITALHDLFVEEEITKDQYKQAVYWVRRVRIYTPFERARRMARRSRELSAQRGDVRLYRPSKGVDTSTLFKVGPGSNNRTRPPGEVIDS